MNLNLNDGINIQIGGEAGKFHTLPIDTLVKISLTLQDLIQGIAKFEIDSSYEIDLSNFKIELSGFRKGSAIAAFLFTPRIKYTISENTVTVQRNHVNERFNELMIIADKGNFNQLKEEYSDSFRRNEIVKRLSDFTNSTGKSPMAFTKIKKTGELEVISNIQKIKPKILKSLLVDIKKVRENFTEDYGVANIKYKISKDGIKKIDIVDDIRDHDAVLSYVADEIQYMGKIYKLHDSLICTLEKEEDYYVIENSILGIVGTGINIEYAKTSFAQEFDYIFNRYNELLEDELTTRIRRAKDFMNMIVKEIVN